LFVSSASPGVSIGGMYGLLPVDAAELDFGTACMQRVLIGYVTDVLAQLKRGLVCLHIFQFYFLPQNFFFRSESSQADVIFRFFHHVHMFIYFFIVEFTDWFLGSASGVSACGHCTGVRVSTSATRRVVECADFGSKRTRQTLVVCECERNVDVLADLELRVLRTRAGYICLLDYLLFI
jgi:hypothetical protein